jgi:hypothetical protein
MTKLVLAHRFFRDVRKLDGSATRENAIFNILACRANRDFKPEKRRFTRAGCASRSLRTIAVVSSYDRLRKLEKSLAMTNDYLAEFKKWAAELFHKNQEAEGVELNRAVELIAKAFGVKIHEVAVLGLTQDGRFLRFLAPDTLRAIGQIPLSSGSALAARTVREMRPEIVNHFHVVPHASVFEGVPVAEDERAEPIQKIMSSPILAGGKAVGVLQVSRKGKSPVDAGPDFTPLQLRNLKSIADMLAPCLLICAKE